jgi:hypothetical protein
MFERIAWGQQLHNLSTDDIQALSANELNMFDLRPDASGIDSLETHASMIHDDSWRHRPKAR